MNYFENIKKLTSLFKYKKFNSYNEALEYSNYKYKDAYNSIELCKYRFSQTNEYLKDRKVQFDYSPHYYLLFGINYYLRSINNRCPNIIDFGGGTGASIFFLKLLFGDLIFSKSWIIESKGMVEESKKWEFASNLQYFSEMRSVLNANKIDIFFSSGTIQCLEDPLEPIEIISELNIPIIILVTNNFSDNPEILVQKSKLFKNSFPLKTNNFQNKNIYYPNTQVKKEKIIQIFIDKGYNLILDVPVVKGTYGRSSYGSEMIFIKSEYIK